MQIFLGFGALFGKSCFCLFLFPESHPSPTILPLPYDTTILVAIERFFSIPMEGIMKAKFAVLCCLLVLGATSAGSKLIAPEKVAKVGDRAPLFSLVDHEGRLVDYKRDFYGQHHLILTFFPAAFTPV
jgi:hypothetical protein